MENKYFSTGFLQMTKYSAMRECEDIPLCCDSAFAQKKEFSIFKFPEMFLEISCRDLTIFSLLLTTPII
jgi:hypothetical protein